jgi:DNA-binding IclR family transcriptional regulator
MINETKGIQSVERALVILETIAAAGGDTRLVDLADRLGLHKSTLHGLLNTLAAMGYIARHGSRYTLGLKLWEVAQPLSNVDSGLRAAFTPALVAMRDLTGENSYLAVPCGTRHYIYIDTLCGTDNMLLRSPRGKREALTTSATGRVFLALDTDLSRSLRKAGLLSADVERDIGVIIERGYALDLERAEKGLNCMALPLRKQGQMVAALSVAGPAERLSEQALIAVAGRVMREMYDMVKL